MRTTLDIADDVLLAVKERARQQKRSAGDSKAKKPKSFYGFDPLPPRGEPVSNELIDRLPEEDLG
jgi:hypothetical protein